MCLYWLAHSKETHIQNRYNRNNYSHKIISQSIALLSRYATSAIPCMYVYLLTINIVMKGNRVLDDEDITLLEDFQTYAGRRIQCFRQSFPRATSYVGLGWIRVELYIYIKKLLFIRTIAILGGNSVCKRVFMQRFIEFNQERDVSFLNVLSSPTFDMLRIAHMFGLEDVIGQMLHGTRVYTKVQWRNIVWTKAWEIEHQD